MADHLSQFLGQVNLNQGELSISNLELKWKVNIQEMKSKKKSESIHSKTFFISNTIEKLYLLFYPKGDKNSINDNMGLFLYNDNAHEITVDYSFSLLNNDNAKVYLKEIKNRNIKPMMGWGHPNFIPEKFVFDPVKKLINNGKITIVLTIQIENIKCEKKDQISLRKKNQKLFTNRSHSDVTIKSYGQEFYLHKCMLSTCSSVFEAMFETDMIENNKNVVEINDVEPEILKQFFKYLYINKVDNLQEIAIELLIIADKYIVLDLKKECEETLSCSINMENAIEYFKIAEIHNAEKLKREVLKFIGLNKNRFKHYVELESLSKEQLLQIIKC